MRTSTMTAADKLGKLLAKKSPARPAGPLWEGPNGQGKNGGCTQGLLSRYVVCKERFRVRYVEGLAPAERFDHKLFFGSCWHIGEQILAGRAPTEVTSASIPGPAEYDKYMFAYAKQQSAQYPLDREKINHWYQVARAVFPLYVRHWAEHPDVTARRPLLAEYPFDVPYQLPSGRKVRLRGKMDSVDLVTGPAGTAGVWLAENKTKGDIRPEKIQQQLTDDIQVMLYFVALQHYMDSRIGALKPSSDERRYWGTAPLRGVRYNVVRRPLSGGKGTITRKKGSKNVREETPAEFYDRVASYVREAPEEFFMRWNVTVSPGDVARFRREVLDPLLENLLDDYEWWTSCYVRRADVWKYERRAKEFPEHGSRLYRVPYGINLSLYEGGETDIDEFLRTGSTAGLARRTVVFPEMEDGSP